MFGQDATEVHAGMQVKVAIQSTGSLLTAFPFFAKEEQLLKRVALLLRPMYALAGKPTQCFVMTGPFADKADILYQGHAPPDTPTCCRAKT